MLVIFRNSFKHKLMVDRRSILQRSAAFGAMSGLQKVWAATTQLQVGVMPTLSARMIATQYEPMQAYLSQKLETSVNLSTATDVTAFYRNIQANQYDVVISAPHIARLIQTQHGFKPIANFQPNVKCVLVTLKSSESFFKSLLKNSQITHSDPASLLTLEAEKWLEKQGLKSGTDFELNRVKSAENIGISIARGEACAGVMSMNVFFANPSPVREKLNVAHLISEIPAFYIMAAPRMSQTNLSKLATVYANFSQKSIEGKEFEARTTFRVAPFLSEKELVRMDDYLDKTRKIIS
jgi:phosphonate transport system substrate-binding protein